MNTEVFADKLAEFFAPKSFWYFFDKKYKMKWYQIWVEHKDKILASGGNIGYSMGVTPFYYGNHDTSQSDDDQ